MTDYRRVEPIAADHEVAEFDCGSEAQTGWLRQHALQAHRSDTAKVYVICPGGARRVAGYYALAAGSVAHDLAPPRLTKGIGRYPIPVVVLTRLGVDLRDQGQGLGSELVRDAILQTSLVARKIGIRALLIHAETVEAAQFYRRISTAFVASPADPQDLMLLMKDLRRTLEDVTTKGESRASDG